MSAYKWTPGPWAGYPDEGSVLDTQGNEVAMVPALADVPLIAAAPELYDALGGLFNALDSCVELTPALLLKCRAALAKARGEA